MRVFWVVCIALSIAGCAADSTQSCRTLACMHIQARGEIANNCMRHLVRYPRKLQEQIDAEYRYPLTNQDSYFAWLKLGNRGPSPWEWCKSYAKVKYRVAIPTVSVTPENVSLN